MLVSRLSYRRFTLGSNVRCLIIYLQVSASTNKEVDAAIPNYPGLQPQLICQLHNVTMHVRCSLF